MKEAPENLSEVVAAGVKRASREFTERIEATGFGPSKSMWWTRRKPYTAEFIYLFRLGSSYGKPNNYSIDFRVHWGVRVLNDPEEYVHLNGPNSDEGDRIRKGKYHLRFNARTWSTFDRCIADLVRFIANEIEPWFANCSDANLAKKDSPLSEAAKLALCDDLAGGRDDARVIASLKLLGIKSI